MTVPRRTEEAREVCFPTASPSTKGHWPAAMENDSPSWDRNSRVTSSSWPGEAEVAATRKILQLWYAIERNIYGESEPEVTSEPSAEECNQWRSQLIHLRVIGKGSSSLANRQANEATNASGSGNEESARRSGTNDDRDIAQTLAEDSVYRSEGSIGNAAQLRLVENEGEVFDQLLEHVCNELARRRDENKDSLGQDLDEVLRITPAPTYSGRTWRTNGRKKRENGESRRASANGKGSALDGPSNEPDPASRETPADRTENGDGGARVDESTTEKLRVARNKLGTVFNEKIVVSPVPFVLSTRESFTTLRTTPISFRTRNFKISSSEGLGRYMNSASTMISGHRVAPSRVSQIHSAWQAPVCPTVWPKNIKLAPIDPARLPSSKNRSSIDSMAALPHRNRNSLSPILRPAKPATSAAANRRNNSLEGLEIQGKQIVTRSPKKNPPKTGGWECSPRNLKNARNKARAVRIDREK